MAMQISKESGKGYREIRNIRRSGNSSRDRIPILGLSSGEVGLCGIW
jgi:hypothetical protein